MDRNLDFSDYLLMVTNNYLLTFLEKPLFVLINGWHGDIATLVEPLFPTVNWRPSRSQSDIKTIRHTRNSIISDWLQEVSKACHARPATGKNSDFPLDPIRKGNSKVDFKDFGRTRYLDICRVFFSIGRLHAITLLTTLNAREKIRQSDDDTGTKPGRTSPLVFRPLTTGKSSIRDGAKVVKQCQSLSVMRTKHQMNMQRDGLSHMIGGEGDAYELQDLPTGKYDSAIYLHFLLKHSFKIYLEQQGGREKLKRKRNSKVEEVK
ncbi:uncharacterized protein C8R40DRAFT_1068066 [Lentinula edodes]|uniref:uncharacterized protein n=1 Tax=Lentinula edodes TaxID=5353 RepID=UPI001E8CF060|nr:uncharacterized protein C8R40DRAFT_1068066 [Lentinula edodes]KAH7877366.1 hypothetical protein C8R40DRAFT_1068066 [Lentinula edodes]